MLLSQTVVINEVAWMGTAASSADEWIELFNNSSSAVDLSGWKLGATDGVPSIDLNGIIAAHSYFLLERTDDNTISDITADQTYSNALEDEGEDLELTDGQNNLVDKINCSTGWFAGRNIPTKNSMERKHPGINGNDATSWATNNGITRNGRDANGNQVNGTPGQQNSMYDSSLPVELSTFYGRAYKNAAELFWITQSEINNHGFYILRAEKEDGSYQDISGLIPGVGTSSDKHEYSYRDERVEVGRSYWYQLKQIDYDGAFKIHGPVKVSITSGESFKNTSSPNECSLLGSYPNPFNAGTKIVLMVGTDVADVQVEIFDLLGRKVSTLVAGNLAPGRKEYLWNGADDQGQPLPTGVYFCTISSAKGGSTSIKLVKMD